MNTDPDIDYYDYCDDYPYDDDAYARFARVRRVLICAGVVFLVLLGALAFPSKWGGQMSYLSLDGISMQPTLYAKDLAVLRETHDYKVGDIVAYEPVGSHDAFYLHRIRKIDASGYTFKGDNNKEDDPRVIKQEQIIGEMLFHVPKAGALITSKPFLFGLAGLIILLTYGVAMLPDRWQPLPALSRGRERLHAGVAHMMSGASHIKWSMFVIAVVLAIGALFVRASAPSAKAPENVHAQLSYSGVAEKSETYPDGKISSGDTIYTKLTDKIDVQWKTEGLTATGLRLYLRDGQAWKREIKLDGAWRQGAWHATVDIDEIIKLTDKIQAQTSVANSTWTLQFKPSGITSGVAAPGYNFQLNAGVLRPADKAELDWSPNAAPSGRSNTALWSVMLAAGAIAFIILGIMDNQPKPQAQRLQLTAQPAGEWLEVDSPDEIEALALKLDVPIMEHSSGMYVIGSGLTQGFRYTTVLAPVGVSSEVA